MKTTPSKSNGSGAKKKKKRNDSVIGSVGHAAKNVGHAAKNVGNAYSKYVDVQKNIVKAVAPVKEIKKIAKGKGNKNDYASVALSGLSAFSAPVAATVGTTRGALELSKTRVAANRRRRAKNSKNSASINRLKK